MEKYMADDVLLQVAIEPELMARVVTQRERLGMTSREFMRRLLLEALPRWEATPDPMPRSATAG